MITQKHTFSQLFFIKKGKLNVNGEAPIYLRITVNGERTEISLHRTIAIELWDNKLGSVIGNSKPAKQMNDYLFSIKASIFEAYKYLREAKKELSATLIKNYFLGVEDEENKVTIVNVFAQNNEKLTDLIGIDYRKCSVTKYETTLKHLKNFIKFKFKVNDIDIENVNNQFIIDFEFYLKTQCNCVHNTTMKYIRIFKKIVKDAMANDLLKKDPFVNFKITFKKTERDFLSEEELNTLINKKFKIERLSQVRDTFLFSCFTGLAHSDLIRLTRKNIVTGTDGNMWVKINRQKTGAASSIPILSVSAQLIEKYKNHPTCIEKDVLLPVLTNQRMNAYLKEIADMCGIDKELTSHVARHTFATMHPVNYCHLKTPIVHIQ